MERPGTKAGYTREPIVYHRQVLDGDQTRLLVVAAAAGDQAAWERLVDEYSGLVWSVIRGCGLFGAEAADVSQTVWLRFVEHVDRIRQAERAGAWLATTARHECFRVLRRSGRQVLSADVPEIESPDDAETLVQALATADDRRAVLSALEAIPFRCQELLRLIAAEPPLTYDEIAAAMEVPTGVDRSHPREVPQPPAPGAGRRRVPAWLRRGTYPPRRRRLWSGEGGGSMNAGGVPHEADEQLMQLTALALSDQEAVPAEVVAAAKAAWTWRTIDAELAELAHDSSLDDALAGCEGRRHAAGAQLQPRGPSPSRSR